MEYRRDPVKELLFQGALEDRRSGDLEQYKTGSGTSLEHRQELHLLRTLKHSIVLLRIGHSNPWLGKSSPSPANFTQAPASSERSARLPASASRRDIAQVGRDDEMAISVAPRGVLTPIVKCARPEASWAGSGPGLIPRVRRFLPPIGDVKAVRSLVGGAVVDLLHVRSSRGRLYLECPEFRLRCIRRQRDHQSGDFRQRRLYKIGRGDADAGRRQQLHRRDHNFGSDH